MNEKTEARASLSLDVKWRNRLDKIVEEMGLINRSDAVRRLIKLYEDNNLK